MKKGLGVLVFLCAIFVYAPFKGMSAAKASEVVPPFELWNKTDGIILFKLHNTGHQDEDFVPLAPGGWYVNHEVNLNLPTVLRFKQGPHGAVQSYTFTLGKNIFVSIKEEEGNLVLVPQTGPLKGLRGVTERGYSKKNAVTKENIKKETGSGRTFSEFFNGSNRSSETE